MIQPQPNECMQLQCMVDASFLLLMFFSKLTRGISTREKCTFFVCVEFIALKLDAALLVLCKSPDTQGLKATSRCELQLFFSRGHCRLLLGLKQGYPFHSPYECRLGYLQFEAWPVEQKALPPQLYVASVTTGIRNPHPADQTPVLESGALNRSAMTLPTSKLVNQACYSSDF